MSPGLGWGSSGAAVLCETPTTPTRPTPHTVHAAHRVAGEGAWSHGAAAGVGGVLLGGGHRHKAHPEGAAQRGDVSNSDPRPWASPGPCWACRDHVLTGAGERRAKWSRGQVTSDHLGLPLLHPKRRWPSSGPLAILWPPRRRKGA
jgi:hypothetical protein